MMQRKLHEAKCFLSLDLISGSHSLVKSCETVILVLSSFMLGIFAHLHSVSVHWSQLRQNWQSLKQSWTKSPGSRQKIPILSERFTKTYRKGGRVFWTLRGAQGPPVRGQVRGHRPVSVPAGISADADRSHIPSGNARRQERGAAHPQASGV